MCPLRGSCGEGKSLCADGESPHVSEESLHTNEESLHTNETSPHANETPLHTTPHPLPEESRTLRKLAQPNSTVLVREALLLNQLRGTTVTCFANCCEWKGE